MVYVRPYTKKDGTRVRGHIRGLPSAGGQSASGLGLAALIIGGLFFWGGTPGSTSTPTAATSWEADGFTVTQINTSHDGECSNHAYGQVQQFFQQNPCVELHRTLLRADDHQGNTMLIAASRTDMSSSNDADSLKRLADRGGSGNVTDLARETPGYGATKFTGQNYTSQTRGSSAHIAEAEALTGNPSASTMRDLARQALDHL